MRNKRLTRHLMRCGAESWCVPVFKQQLATFRLPMNVRSPIVCVAAGTGLAPLRGFIQHRMHLVSQGSTLGPCILVFGARSKKFCSGKSLCRMPYAVRGCVGVNLKPALGKVGWS